MNGYQLGTLAFTAGTAVWGGEAVAAGVFDIAALAYAIGCLLFLDDAFKLRTRVLARAASTQSSYRAGSVAYAAGTALWGVAVYRDTGVIDRAAVIYGVGCVYFLLDAFGVAMPRGLRITNQQLGSVAFLIGTVIWGMTGGVSVPVAAYGFGCLFFVQDAFRARAASGSSPPDVAVA